MFLRQTNFVLFNCLFFFLFYILIDKAQQKSNAFTQPFTAAGNPTGPQNKKPLSDCLIFRTGSVHTYFFFTVCLLVIYILMERRLNTIQAHLSTKKPDKVSKLVNFVVI